MCAHHFVEYPRRREYERYVGDHVHDGREVYGETADVVEFYDYVRYDAVLDPLHRVGHRARNEHGQHRPPSQVQIALGDRRLPVLVAGHPVLYHRRAFVKSNSGQNIRIISSRRGKRAIYPDRAMLLRELIS